MAAAVSKYLYGKMSAIFDFRYVTKMSLFSIYNCKAGGQITEYSYI